MINTNAFEKFLTSNGFVTDESENGNLYGTLSVNYGRTIEIEVWENGAVIYKPNGSHKFYSNPTQAQLSNYVRQTMSFAK